jgi:hypothetical protein
MQSGKDILLEPVQDLISYRTFYLQSGASIFLVKLTERLLIGQVLNQFLTIDGNHYLCVDAFSVTLELDPKDRKTMFYPEESIGLLCTSLGITLEDRL